jgi:drug/metabolite transporter (DMT)-like permease
MVRGVSVIAVSETADVGKDGAGMARGFGPKLIGSLAAVYLIWSSTYLGMKVVLQTFGPMTLGAMRFLIAGLVLYFVYRVRGGTRPTRAQVLAAIPTGLLMFLAGNGFVAIAQHGVTSGVASIVASTTPLWAALIGALLGEQARRDEWLGVGLGTVGVALLALKAELGGDPLMIAVLLLAPVGWALGTVLARRVPQAKGLGAPALQMTAGGVGMAIAAMLSGETLPSEVAGETWAIFAYLVVCGSLIGFTAFSWLLTHTRPSLALSYSYVNPLLALILGAVVAGEPVHETTVIATVILGVAVALVVRSAVAKRRHTR